MAQVPEIGDSRDGDERRKGDDFRNSSFWNRCSDVGMKHLAQIIRTDHDDVVSNMLGSFVLEQVPKYFIGDD